jgi:hypothetical protein
MVGGALASLTGLPFNKNCTAVITRAHIALCAADAATAGPFARHLASRAPNRAVASDGTNDAFLASDLAAATV